VVINLLRLLLLHSAANGSNTEETDTNGKLWAGKAGRAGKAGGILNQPHSACLAHQPRLQSAFDSFEHVCEFVTHD
jgi:hypothetical protein